ncbi:MAG: SPFH domain-containing protein, partial [Bacteroidetes bacterium]|nr:SPFH domain-containing protein [Bacteroidota bacterium]
LLKIKIMKKIQFVYLIAAIAALLSSCAVIRPGEVGLKVKYGKIKPDIMTPGIYARGILGTRIERFDTRVIEYSKKLGFHSKEGIEVTSELTLLYHLVPDSVQSIYKKFNGLIISLLHCDRRDSTIMPSNLLPNVRRLKIPLRKNLSRLLVNTASLLIWSLLRRLTCLTK